MGDQKTRKGVFKMSIEIRKISIGFLVSVLFVTGCGKKIYTESRFGKNKTQETTTTDPSEPLRPIDLGESSQFAVLSYANITSNPNSQINGKVGAMPATRKMININPSEVSGGAGDIMGSDDETTPSDFLSRAKSDMVMAYNTEVSLAADSDKIGLFQGEIGGKNLSAGVYEFTSSISVSKDITLEGTEDDVWIFKIPGHMKVASGVNMILKGKAKAKNIFWQVAGNAVLGSKSNFSGSIIAQQFIDLKNHAVLTGRAFAKNGYVNLDQATINMP